MTYRDLGLGWKIKKFNDIIGALMLVLSVIGIFGFVMFYIGFCIGFGGFDLFLKIGLPLILIPGWFWISDLVTERVCKGCPARIIEKNVLIRRHEDFVSMKVFLKDVFDGKFGVSRTQLVKSGILWFFTTGALIFGLILVL